MRELAASEIMAVSGGGLLQDMTANVGMQAGSMFGNMMGSLLPIPFVSGLIACVASNLFGTIGGWIGSVAGEMVENQVRAII